MVQKQRESIGHSASTDRYGTMPVEVFRVLIGPLANLTAVTAGGYLVALVLGWAYWSSYFQEAGAPWVLNLLSVSSIAKPGLVFGGPGLVVFAAFLWPMRHPGLRAADLKPFFKGAVAAIVFAAILQVVSSLIFGEAKFWLFLLAMLGIFGVMVVIYVGAKIVEDDEGTAKVRAFGLMLMLGLVAYCGFSMAGEFAASEDFDSAKSLLSVAGIKGEVSLWRVASVVSSDKIVLVRIGGRPVFRVVNADAIQAIVPVAQPASIWIKPQPRWP